MNTICEKIVFIGYPSPFNKQLCTAFEKRGVQIIHISDRSVFGLQQKGGGRLWSWMRSISSLKKWNNNRFNSQLIELCKKENPDALVTTKGVIIKPETLDALRMLNIKTIIWSLENLKIDTYKQWFSNIYKKYDHFLSFDPTVKQEYGFTTGYLPFAVDINVYDEIEAVKDQTQIDVCFVGAPYSEREELLTKLIDAGISVSIYGWKGWQDTKLKDYYKGPLDLQGMINVYRQSKICLNMNLHPRNGGANQKTFEIIASSGFELTDDQRDISNLFEIDREIVVFKNIEDVIAKIKYYLNHDHERKLIATAGYQRVKREHTFNGRADEIIKLIK